MQTPLIILYNVVKPYVHHTTELGHKQTHSTYAAPLCSDQSHLKGFPLPIHSRDRLFIYFYMAFFAFQVEEGSELLIQ